MIKTLAQLRAAQRASSKAYRDRMKDNPEFKEKNRLRFQAWYAKKRIKDQIENDDT